MFAAKARPLRLGLLQLLDSSLDRVVGDEVVADGGVEDLAQPRQRLVDRPVRQRTLDQPLLALAHLGRLVAVGLLRGDLAEQVILEEGEKVPRQRQLVVLTSPIRELMPPHLEPLRGELVEGWLSLRLTGFVGFSRLPDLPPHVGEDVGQLLLGLLAGPAVC
ncbi:MAG TPA: hypothetical protein VGH14_05830 [Solirubrobacterales bacterium]